MIKGAILIGCGFVPTQGDVRAAFREGHLKNCSAVDVAGFKSQVQIDLALNTYLHITQAKGWSDPVGLEVQQFVAGNGYRVWSICPLG